MLNRANILERLQAKGWCVNERPGRLQWPAEIARRHPNRPPAFESFLEGLFLCVDAAQETWFLCEPDYFRTSDAGFHWDEWERLSLDAAAGMPRVEAAVRAFWDHHLPFMMSVGDGYSYHAIRTVEPGFGHIVAGREPEFEEATLVAESFESFLESLVA